jgi:hypothetical protein
MPAPAAFSVAALAGVAWRTPSHGPAGAGVAVAVGEGSAFVVGAGVLLGEGAGVAEGAGVGVGDAVAVAMALLDGDGDGDGVAVAVCPWVVASLAAVGWAVARVPPAPMTRGSRRAAAIRRCRIWGAPRPALSIRCAGHPRLRAGTAPATEG